MIIFGWGHQTTKNFGPTFKNHCGHCNNDEYFALNRIMTWFTLFFIPVIPYSIKYFLSCPICQYGLVLNDEQIGKIKPVAEANQSLIDGKITEQEYQLRINQLSDSGEAELDSPKKIETKANSNVISKTKNIFCSNCGNSSEPGSKFCTNCGKKIK